MNSFSQLPSFLNRDFNFGHSPEASLKFHEDLETIVYTKDFLKLDNAGNFARIGVIGWIWEQFKGLIGFENHTRKEYLSFRLIQFVAQAADEGLLTKNDCIGPNNLLNQVAKKVGLTPSGSQPDRLKEIQQLFQAIIQHVNNPSAPKPDFNGLVHSYSINHRDEIAPQSLLQRIQNAWKQKQTTQQDELDSLQKPEGSLEFSEGILLETNHPTSNVLPKNPSIFDLLSQLSKTDDLADELGKLTPSKEFSYKDLFLRLFVIKREDSSNDKLIREWISNMLSPTKDINQKLLDLDRALKLLDFKNAFALLAGAYRFSLLLKNEEDKQLDYSAHFIKQCEQMAVAMGSRLETLIAEYPAAYQALDLSSFSLTAPVMQIDPSALTYQFLFEIIEQKKLHQERQAAAIWKNAIVLGSLLGATTLFGGATYVIKKLLAPLPPPPPPKLTDHLYSYLGPIAATVAILGVGVFTLYKCATPAPKPPKKIKPPGQPFVSIDINWCRDALKSNEKTSYVFSNNRLEKTRDLKLPNDFNNLEILKNTRIDDHELLIPIPQNTNNVYISVITYNSLELLVINIPTTDGHYVCGFDKDALCLYDNDKKKRFKEGLKYVLKNIKIGKEYIEIPFLEDEASYTARIKEEAKRAKKMYTLDLAKTQYDLRNQKKKIHQRSGSLGTSTDFDLKPIAKKDLRI